MRSRSMFFSLGLIVLFSFSTLVLAQQSDQQLVQQQQLYQQQLLQQQVTQQQLAQQQQLYQAQLDQQQLRDLSVDVVVEPDVYLFGGDYDRGRYVHTYSHRGFESRGRAHSGGRIGRR